MLWKIAGNWSFDHKTNLRTIGVEFKFSLPFRNESSKDLVQFKFLPLNSLVFIHNNKDKNWFILQEQTIWHSKFKDVDFQFIFLFCENKINSDEQFDKEAWKVNQSVWASIQS